MVDPYSILLRTSMRTVHAVNRYLGSLEIGIEDWSTGHPESVQNQVLREQHWEEMQASAQQALEIQQSIEEQEPRRNNNMAKSLPQVVSTTYFLQKRTKGRLWVRNGIFETAVEALEKRDAKQSAADHLTQYRVVREDGYLVDYFSEVVGDGDYL
jgi:hypothetical protein